MTDMTYPATIVGAYCVRCDTTHDYDMCGHYEGQPIERLVNLTPHPVRVFGGDYVQGIIEDVLIAEYPPSGQVARLAEDATDGAPGPDGVTVRSVTYGAADPLPEPDGGRTAYIVSLAYALAVGRPDLLVAYDAVRNPEGTIIGCRSLATVRHG